VVLTSRQRRIAVANMTRAQRGQYHLAVAGGSENREAAHAYTRTASGELLGLA
jgi:hypothetical protein